MERIDRVLDVFYSDRFFWGVLWAGLMALTIALLVLMRTRWGQTQPLRKCVILSLLAHLLLAVYASSVQLVTAASGAADAPEVTVRVAEIEPLAESEEADEPSSLPDAPWNALGSTPAETPPTAEPARAELPAAPPAERSDQSADHLLEAVPEPLPEEPTNRLETPAPDWQSPLANRAAATEVSPEVAAPQAERRDEPAPPVPSLAAPPRVKTDREPEPQPVPSSTTPATPLDQSASEPRLAETPNSTEAAEALQGIFDAGNALPAPAPPAPELTPLVGPLEPLRPQAAPSGLLATSPAPLPTAPLEPGPVRSGQSAPPELLDTAVGPPSPAVVPAPLEDRVAPDRLERARRYGGSAETEAAVRAALAWLAQSQNPDGRWDAQKHGAGRSAAVEGRDRGRAGLRSDTGMTGLALLAFLGSGQTHLQGEHREIVRRGLDFLARSQRADGSLGGTADSYAFMYCHGMAGLALSEAWALTSDPRLEPTVRKAVAYTLSAQNPATGGWRYQPGDLGDTSQLGWQLMLLRSAELGGLKLPLGARQGAIRYLQTVSSGLHQGLASYRPRERASRVMTAEALVCRQMLGLARENPASDEAGDYLLAELPGAAQANFYYWYYATLGMFQLQGAHWQRWNTAMQASLLPSQRTDGEQAGSWDPNDVWGSHGGRVYSTAMGALCLEVYYRFLPVYGVATRGAAATSGPR